MASIFALSLMIGLSSRQTHAAQTLTVSGLSSGGYFAHQFHVANSSWVKGAAVLAGGPYACAKDGVGDAFERCMDVNGGAPSIEDSLKEIRLQARAKTIDNPENLNRSRVYVLTGTHDQTVVGAVVKSLVRLYDSLGAQTTLEDKLPVGHAFPTLDFGNECGVASQAPYISNCHRDIAGELLKTLLGPLQPRTMARKEGLMRFSQGELAQIVDPTAISMARTGYAYVPKSCAAKGVERCQLHVAFHGCRQTTAEIGDDFLTKTGLNEWAEANQIVVLYPQTIRNVWLMNPRGCWDWWGYTGGDFYNQRGPQMAAVARIARAFLRGTVKLLPVTRLSSEE